MSGNITTISGPMLCIRTDYVYNKVVGGVIKEIEQRDFSIDGNIVKRQHSARNIVPNTSVVTNTKSSPVFLLFSGYLSAAGPRPTDCPVFAWDTDDRTILKGTSPWTNNIPLIPTHYDILCISFQSIDHGVSFPYILFQTPNQYDCLPREGGGTIIVSGEFLQEGEITLLGDTEIFYQRSFTSTDIWFRMQYGSLKAYFSENGQAPVRIISVDGLKSVAVIATHLFP